MHRMLVAALLLLPLSAEAETPFGADRPGWQAACATYENRARFMPREGEVGLTVVLAEACRGALASLDSGEPAQRDAAVRLLTRIAALRDTIVAMSVEKAYVQGRRPAPEARGARPMARVSATGEYLIAHAMGVVDALDRWVETGAPYSLAAR
ncbi:MAG TPA: hypothetical protein VMM55_01875 [Thermohalobaculum sp.]|nr:hypothetical protein [Thermohalobaculum sp.]